MGVGPSVGSDVPSFGAGKRRLFEVRGGTDLCFR